MTDSWSPIRVSRGHRVALAIVIAFAFGGLLVGLRPMPRPAQGRPNREARAPSSEAPPGVSYRGLRERRAAGDSAATDFELLRAGLPAIAAPVERDEAALQDALVIRASRRAYDGAPPVIPHAIDERSSASCPTCHQHGVRINGRTAPAISHETYTNCTQCHVPSAARMGSEASVLSENAFAGRVHAPHGPRAWPGAPPAIPHPLWMRNQCASCHGVSGRVGIRTTHPERANCTQCHVPAQGAAPQM